MTILATPAASIPRPGVLSRLRDGLRIAFFRRVPETRLSPTWLEIAAAAALTILVPTLYSLFTLDAPGRLASWQLPQAGFHVLVMTLAAAVVGALLRRNESVPVLIFAMLLAWVVIDTATLLAWLVFMRFADPSWEWLGHIAFYYVPLAWLALATWRFATGLERFHGLRRGRVFMASVLFILGPMAFVHPERSLWVKDWTRAGENVAGADRWSITSEDAFYKQPELLARELAAVEAGRMGIVDVFFIGVAGYGQQDVFMREIDSVARLMRERFDAGGRIVKLVNNSKTALTSPIASSTSLRAALARTAQQMDAAEDVLVLFLTSHGTADHRFSLELGPMRFHELTPASLRRLLDESGIRNRVVVVSACYAGGFIEELKDDHTLVITAAAPERNSFGCSNENEWTYFGRAYFDEALRATHSFTGAFEIARPVIEQREREQKFLPSDPRMAAGESIKAKLTQLEAQLQSPRQRAISRDAPSPPTAERDRVTRYVDLFHNDDIALGYRDACKTNMEQNGPSKTLDRSVDAYGGFDKRSLHWPRFESAWERYAQAYCAAAMDPRLFRTVYSKAVRSAMGAAEMDAMLRFVSTDLGKRWLAGEHEINRLSMLELSRAQEDAAAQAQRAFVAERDRIFADFHREAAATPKR